MKLPVVILQYGRFDLTRACIESVRAQSYPVEIILVDGNSPGKSPEILHELAKLADRFIGLEENLGYAGANNMAIRQLIKEGYPNIAVLNNDTVVHEGFFDSMMQLLEKQFRCAQVVGKVLYPDGKLQSAGGRVARHLFEPQLRGHLDNVDAYTKSEQIGYAPGVAFVVRSKAAEEVGLISEDYFMYGEDVDFSLSLAKSGWEIWYCPDAQITHFDSANIGQFSYNKGFYLTRANLILVKKWADSSERKKLVVRIVMKLVRQSIKFIAHPKFVYGMWRGYFSGVKQ